jgi:hypothetical protein
MVNVASLSGAFGGKVDLVSQAATLMRRFLAGVDSD